MKLYINSLIDSIIVIWFAFLMLIFTPGCTTGDKSTSYNPTSPTPIETQAENNKVVGVAIATGGGNASVSIDTNEQTESNTSSKNTNPLVEENKQ